MRTGTETYERKSDAERALSLIEAQVIKGEWNDPDRGKIKLREYAETWIAQRPGLRPRTVDLYRWLLKKHIAPYLGNVQIARSARLPFGCGGPICSATLYPRVWRPRRTGC
ncbi:hypothetical protein [Nonomuraea sp. NPDC049709]|uniref:hypothetical protein n=1 Tax=Nonomuraea sp. NPDC049709 TaxID=3154736 RepID=UPI00343716AC